MCLEFQKSVVKGTSVSSNILPDVGEVDVVLISEQQEGMGDTKGVQNPNLRVGAHHICHCRYEQMHFQLIPKHIDKILLILILKLEVITSQTFLILLF